MANNLAKKIISWIGLEGEVNMLCCVLIFLVNKIRQMYD